MSSTHAAAKEHLRQILTDYCRNGNAECPDIERLKNLFSKVSDDQRYELLSSITDSYGYTVLTLAAYRGHTELCVTLLSSLPPADRLKLILVDGITALHTAAYRGYTNTISGILNCLTADQQLQLLFTQDSIGDTALHDSAQRGRTETVKALFDNLTSEQQLKLLFVLDNAGKTACQLAAASKQKEIGRAHV